MLNFYTVWLFLLLLLAQLMLLAILIVLVYFCKPVWLIKLWIWYRIWKAGFSEHCVKITDKLEISYLNKKGSSTEAQVLLFIHGFSSDKAVFCEVVRCLPSKYHVISIDLPGHGKSKPNDTQSDYRLSVMADYVHEFVQACGLENKKLSIIGSSMGGAIAGVYVARYGDNNLSSVILICPAGIASPVLTEYLQNRQANMGRNIFERNALIPTTASEFKEMIKLVMHRSIKLPSHIAATFVTLKQKKMSVFRKVMRDLSTKDEYLVLDKVLEKIQHPLLCIWGKNDQDDSEIKFPMTGAISWLGYLNTRLNSWYSPVITFTQT